MTTSHTAHQPPTVVLICHERDRLDLEGLGSWLAHSMSLVGLVVVRDGVGRLWRSVRYELKRSGGVGLADVLLFRLYASLALAGPDAQWMRHEVARLKARYPADLTEVPRVTVESPNSELARTFLEAVKPDLVIARCKMLLKPEIFRLARYGSFALHPGICPEYRNAHGCFWALVRRDLGRVGMTLLKIDKGVDTGPVYLHATCAVDEVHESPRVIQYRVVTENLDPIADTLAAVCRDEPIAPLPSAGRASAMWGQPRLSQYLRWKWAARRSRHVPGRFPALP